MILKNSLLAILLVSTLNIISFEYKKIDTGLVLPVYSADNKINAKNIRSLLIGKNCSHHRKIISTITISPEHEDSLFQHASSGKLYCSKIDDRLPMISAEIIANTFYVKHADGSFCKFDLFGADSTDHKIYIYEPYTTPCCNIQ